MSFWIRKDCFLIVDFSSLIAPTRTLSELIDQKLEGSGGDCHAATESVPQNNSPVGVPVDLSEVNWHSFIEMVVPISFSSLQFIPQTLTQCLLCRLQDDRH